MELRLPLKDIFVVQPFGMNYVDFYQKLGMKGHNGIDFRSRDGCPCYAAHYGEVVFAGDSGGGGIAIVLWNEFESYKTIYLHLKKTMVKKGDLVKAGKQIGECDNTGKYTTGQHLHFGLKRTYADSSDTYGGFNGYKGAIDPAKFFQYAYNGQKIGNKDWKKSRCYHRYYRGRPKGGYWIEKNRVVPALIKYLKRLPTNEEINAATYGGWDREAIKNPAMYQNWSQLKKDEYVNKGERPFS